MFVALTTAVLGLASGCSPGPAAEPTSGFSTVKATAGSVDVTVKPTRIDSRGAVFEVAFDTHSVELDLDVAANAALTVGGTAWTGARWSGAKPGGHHRQGTLRFTPQGAATGTARLRLTGLPKPVTATWPL